MPVITAERAAQEGLSPKSLLFVAKWNDTAAKVASRRASQARNDQERRIALADAARFGSQAAQLKAVAATMAGN